MFNVSGPGHYFRQAGLSGKAGEIVNVLGSKACIIGGKTALSKAGDSLIEGLGKEGIAAGEPLWYGGESSWANIHKLVESLGSNPPDFLVGIGGGKAIDTVKSVGYQLNLPVVAVPTIASTCAPSSAISIINDDDGMFLEISRESRPPAYILVDTTIIQEAPYRFLVAGIGDTLAKWFESRATVQRLRKNAANGSALCLAENLYGLLLRSGAQALDALQAGEISPELEDVIDGIILVSGSVSGYGGDDCRTAAAHAVYSALTIFPQVRDTYHGEIVAFGILTQLALEDKTDAEILELIEFYRKVKLPFTLKALGIDKNSLTASQWEELAKVSVEIEDMSNMPFKVTPQMVLDAIQRADALGEGRGVQ